MQAFDAYAAFAIPSTYHDQPETGAAKFLIELRLDPALQRLYRRNAALALNDPRFARLSDRERSVLSTRDAGTIQLVSKGLYVHDPRTERAVAGLLTHRPQAAKALKALGVRSPSEARAKVRDYLESLGYEVDWRRVRRSIDRIHRMHLYPWTGVYVDANQEVVVTVLGHHDSPRRSLVYVNEDRIADFRFGAGFLRWNVAGGRSQQGSMRMEVANGARRLVGQLRHRDEVRAGQTTFVAYEVDPQRKKLAPTLTKILGCRALADTGRHARTVNALSIDNASVRFNGREVDAHRFEAGRLTWRGGDREVHEGEVLFVPDPITDSLELYGTSKSASSDASCGCYGARIESRDAHDYQGPALPAWAATHLVSIVRHHAPTGGLMLWHRWEKHAFTSAVVNRHLKRVI
jgi:hypothetical protein